MNVGLLEESLHDRPEFVETTECCPLELPRPDIRGFADVVRPSGYSRISTELRGSLERLLEQADIQAKSGSVRGCSRDTMVTACRLEA